MSRRVMLVDDELHVLNALFRSVRAALCAEKLKIEVFQDPRAALTRLASTTFDVILSDYRMPAMDGVEFLRLAREVQPDTARVILSASRDFEAVQRAINEAQIVRYLCKPWETKEIAEVISAAFVRRDQLLEERRLADEMRVSRAELSLVDFERRRLEESEPGITKVNWGPDGSVLLEGD